MKLNKKSYIAAVSGGPDSMALLDKFQDKIIAVCHVNYHKRKDSNVDTKIVVDYCKQHKIKIYIYDVKKSEYKNTKNFQNWARQLRYKFFVNCGKKTKCNNLLVAHNLNDFLETAIMQKNRKSLNFFYGIKPTSKYQSLSIYRPLINELKKNLEIYCQQNSISYAIDSSNSSDIYERNRIRKQLANYTDKQLSQLYKNIQDRNSKQAKLEQQVTLSLKQWQKYRYSVSCFKELNPKILDSIIYLYLKNSEINNVNYNKIKLVRDYVVSKKSNNSLRLEENIHLKKKDGKLTIVRS